MINMKVLQAALGNPNSQYFPYYIGTQASKNPASLYAAMVTNATSHSTTQLDIVDFKASRELMQLPGGALGLAFGAEHRREMLDNPSLSGTLDGSINSSYVAAKGDQNISAVFVEVAAPVIKTVELTGAVRYDKYKNFSSTTPKLGAKWTPLKTFAVRGTYSEGFRAPGPAEAGTRVAEHRQLVGARSDPLPGRRAGSRRRHLGRLRDLDRRGQGRQSEPVAGNLEGLHPGHGLGSAGQHQPVAGRLQDPP
jgi:hypothetical protein